MRSDSESNDTITEKDELDQDDLGDELDAQSSQESDNESSREVDLEANSESCQSNQRSHQQSNRQADGEADESQESEANDEQNSESDDEAPEEVQFSSTRKTALQLAESQLGVLNRLKKQAQEKRKMNQERNVEQKKLKAENSRPVKRDESDVEDDDQRTDDPVRSIEKETESSRLKIVLNVDDQIDRMNSKYIRKHRETNNRMVSFKERSIQSNSSIKRMDGSEASRLLHKRRVK